MRDFLKNFILEQDENLITLTPEQYKETLEDVGGIAARVANLKPYRGKGIVINGDLDLRNFKTVGPLTGIVRVMGRLDISHTNVPNLDGVTVDRYVSNWGSTMKNIELRKQKESKIDSRHVVTESNTTTTASISSTVFAFGRITTTHTAIDWSCCSWLTDHGC
mgnify:CR=1 FL=1